MAKRFGTSEDPGRHLPDEGLKDCIRVSIGTSEQMEAFLAAAGKIRRGADSST